uniref:C2H2-type domain-containing protein n=1 Tax=Salmo trutta TaxID=8032 RepID=A0A673WG35_SALTR
MTEVDLAAQCLVSISNRPQADGCPDAKPTQNMSKEKQENRTLKMVAMIFLDLNKCNQNTRSGTCGGGSRYLGQSDANSQINGHRCGHRVSRDSRGTARAQQDKKAVIMHVSPENIHCCPFSSCGKMYGKLSHLKAHLISFVKVMLHSERPFQCTWPDCTKRFSHLDELTRFHPIMLQGPTVRRRRSDSGDQSPTGV